MPKQKLKESGMTKRSQKQRVLYRLIKTGKITTAQAEKMRIDRLSSAIHRLRAEGYKIDSIREADGTTYYRLRDIL